VDQKRIVGGRMMLEVFLWRECVECKDKKLSKYRPEVLTDSNYHADEPID
jgi:hypothetical protein